MSQPWERIEAKGKRRGETNREFAAFHAYLLLGPKRSIAKSIQAIHGEKSTRGQVKNAEKLSSRWKWADRSRAYDLHVAEQERSAFEEKRRRLAKDRAEFEFELHDILKRRAISTAAKLDALEKIPSTDVEDRTVLETEQGVQERVKKVKGLAPSQIAVLQKSLIETGSAAINGVRPQATGKQGAPASAGAGSPTRTFRYVKPTQKTKPMRPKGDD